MHKELFSGCAILAFSLAGPGDAVSSRLPSQGYDWPQWQGPNRNGVSRETGLLKSWPQHGPPLLWQAGRLGIGFSTLAIAHGRIITMGKRGAKEYVIALDERDGKRLWDRAIARVRNKGGGFPGPRCTPTVDGDRVYALGLTGTLVCLDTATGKMRWHKKLKPHFGGKPGKWGYSESPLVDGRKVICTPGGKKATLIALDKHTGRTIWKARVPKGDTAGYSSVVVATTSGQRQYVQFLSGGVVGISAGRGKFLWRYRKPANSTANCSTPVVSGKYVFAASGYSAGGGLVKLARQGRRIHANQVYFTNSMKNQHGGMVLVDGYLYGCNEPGMLVCLNFRTGRVKWKERRPGKGSIAYADGRLYYRNEGGSVRLVEANPNRYVEHGYFYQPSRSSSPSWPYPVVANGRLYLRDQQTLLCYDVKQHE
jgi:outer membrane protein assembly factor BamB